MPQLTSATPQSSTILRALFNEPMLNNAGTAYTAGMNSAADPSIMMDKYRNPYEDQVVQSALGDMRRQYDIAQNQVGANAASSGAFGGSRHALAEAENTRNLMDRSGALSGQLRSQGFTTAAGLGQNATNQMFTAGQGAQGLAQTQLGMGLQSANALAGVGQQQQGLNQADMNNQYGDYLQQMNYPLQALSIRQSAIGQTPMGSVGMQPAANSGTGAAAIGALGQIGSAALPLMMGACWVAREAYGADNPKWLKVRSWMLTKAPADLFMTYMTKGPKIAEAIRGNEARKAEYRAVMDEIVEAA